MSRKKTTEEVIKEFKKIHGDKYDYSKVVYVYAKNKVEIICKKHGLFLQRPNDHKGGQGCIKCSYEKPKYNQLNTELVINKFKNVHGERYEYSKVNYINNYTPVIIICKKHGEFKQSPANHFKGKNCILCSYEDIKVKKTRSQKYIIDKFINVHNNRYDYSKVVYKSYQEKVIIICKDHGEFLQVPNSHIGGNGCPDCGGNRHLTNKEIIIEFAKTHGEKYDYSKVEYTNSNANVKIGCSKHGFFNQVAYYHKNGAGCPRCIGKNKTTAEIIEECKIIHSDRYDYSKLEYVNRDTKVIIICKEHGYFTQSPEVHKNGGGCPKCAGNIKFTLDEIIIEFEKIHNQEYDYSLVDYKNANTKVKIVCKIHGLFEQIPSEHKNGGGCPKCAGNYLLSQDEVIERFEEEHKERYIYDKVEYINSLTKIIIICKIHGEFEQSPIGHYNGQGCPYCTLTPQSKQELIITHELITIFSDINPRGFKTKVNNKIRSIDIFIPQLNLGIEFDGKYWHKDKRAFDKLKTQQLEKEGFNIIRIRQKPLKRIFKDDVMAEKKYNGKQITNDLLKQIMKDFDLDNDKIKNIKDYINKSDLQNEEGLDDYIDMIMEEKAERT